MSMRLEGRFLHGSGSRLSAVSFPLTLCKYFNLDKFVRHKIIMNSNERHELRYQRRKVQRDARRRRKLLSFNDVFSYEHLYKSYQKCRKNVGWKASTQKYIAQAPLNIYKTMIQLQNGSFKSDGFFEFDIFERGKLRHIKSVNIRERVVQRCLCDYALVPVLENILIYDNGASRKNKGYHFAMNRMMCHLKRHYHKYRNEGYILIFDFQQFFDSIPHKLVKEIVCKHFEDKRLIDLIFYFIDVFGDCGLGLGSQISQTLALTSTNKLDHYIKEKLRIKGYGRYMDDSYIIHHKKEYLVYCLNKIREICKELGITLNEKKTHIVKLSHGFTWLKARLYLTETGKVVKKIYKLSITRARRKMKKLYRMYKNGNVVFADVYNGVQSWIAYASNFDAFYTIQNMIKLYNRLFNGRRKKYVLQSC